MRTSSSCSGVLKGHTAQDSNLPFSTKETAVSASHEDCREAVASLVITLPDLQHEDQDISPVPGFQKFPMLQTGDKKKKSALPEKMSLGEKEVTHAVKAGLPLTPNLPAAGGKGAPIMHTLSFLPWHSPLQASS